MAGLERHSRIDATSFDSRIYIDKKTHTQYGVCSIRMLYLFASVVCLVDGHTVQTAIPERFEQITGIGINLYRLLIECRHFGDKIQASLSLLLLQFERNAAHGALGDAAHQVRRVSRNLVAHALGWQYRHIVHQTLVRVKVRGQTSVVLFHNGPSTLLDSLGADTLYFDGLRFYNSTVID
jgi:hypothetical protein